MGTAEIFKIIGLCISIGCIYSAYRFKKKRKLLISTGISVEGVVFELLEDNQFQKPVIRFRTLQDEWITQEYDIGFTPGQLKDGDKLTVYYDPADPRRFVLDTKMEKWVPIVLTVAGLIGFILLLLSLLTDLI